MKKIKKIFIDFIIILIAAVAVFFIGWIQFYVKPGNCGVMVSKTGGLYEKPVVSGSFVWRWERLLPTNVDLRIFSLTPYKSTQVISGELPSSELYSSYLAVKQDFSYRIQLRVSLCSSPEKLVQIVKQNDIHTQEDLNAFYELKAKSVLQNVVKIYMQGDSDFTAYESVLSSEQVKKIISYSSGDLDLVDITGIEVLSSKIPDIALYETARKTYEEYQKKVSDILSSKALEQANRILEEDRSLRQLERFAELMQKYPQLEELSKNGDISSIITALKSLR